jgi:hypothetical protein
VLVLLKSAPLQHRIGRRTSRLELRVGKCTANASTSRQSGPEQACPTGSPLGGQASSRWIGRRRYAGRPFLMALSSC